MSSAVEEAPPAGACTCGSRRAAGDTAIQSAAGSWSRRMWGQAKSPVAGGAGRKPVLRIPSGPKRNLSAQSAKELPRLGGPETNDPYTDLLPAVYPMLL